MLSIFVNDVTMVAQRNQTKQMNTTVKRTSITPFRKVLKKEVEVANKQVDGQDSKIAREPETAKEAGKTSLRSIFERAAEKYDISYDFLVAVAKAESDFNPRCVSSAGAQGIMQVMPYEQKELGIKDPYDPEQNIMGAAKLLKAHLKKFNGDYILAAAAYNAGSGRVQKYGGVPPIKETQNYVKKIQSFMKEGVTVPDKMVRGSGSTSNAEDKKTNVESEKEAFDQGQAATEQDLEKVTVAIGAGDDMLTMSYGAYLKYLEMGSSGVG